MKKSFSILILSLACHIIMLAQELPLILDKPGTFEILSRTDYVSPECGFTKAEINANILKIKDVVNSVRKNPVLSDIRGFDGRARIYNVGCDEDGKYGVPSRISFEFASWYRNKDGTESRGFIEPPEWTLIINKLKPTANRWVFSADDIAGDRSYFIVPLEKKTTEPGIDVYGGECYVIYNPDRPQYWLPVTIKEVYMGIIESFKKKARDTTGRKYMIDLLTKEYNDIPESDLNKPAYYGGKETIVGISPTANFPPIVRVNPAYWDRNLPKSAIQFLYFRSIPNKEYHRNRVEECLKNNAISYHECRFEASFEMENIRDLLTLIEK
jgi:hypothetical protein